MSFCVKVLTNEKRGALTVVSFARTRFKGEFHEIFDFWFFHESVSPKPLSSYYTIWAVSNFFENSRRHSQLKLQQRYRWHRWQFATGTNNTSETGGKICRRCCWHRWCTLTCEYLRELSKKFETVLMGYSGAGGKLVLEKNQKKSRDTVPLDCSRGNFQTNPLFP